ncbi:hypothetical protein V3528_15805, partial [Acinetobacter johnsonii]|uniref:hypothetical protein n=1 Tax=Acinetobacter johnsonii TaxID=40214 RepID=UPI0030F5C769
TTYPSYALNLAQLGALCISNLCATKPFFNLIGSNQPIKHLITDQLAQLINPLFCGLIHIYRHKIQYYGFKIQKT